MSGSGRLALLDSLRGLTLISMILFHACWDAVYLLGVNWPWYGSRAAYIWQQSICWTFIMLSGFCIPFSSKLLRRGLEVFGAGALVMAVTCILLPEDRVVFGVLTLIGSCMLLMVPLRKLLDGNGKAAILFIVFAILFILFKDVNYGEIGTGMLHRIVPTIPKLTIRIPEALYANLASGSPGCSDSEKGDQAVSFYGQKFTGHLSIASAGTVSVRASLQRAEVMPDFA